MRKIIGRILVAISFACGLAWFLVFYHYIDTQPSQPDASTGRTNELSNHGTVVFITDGQQITLWVLQDAGIFILIFGALMAESARRRP
jgi:hypothetical protein